MGFFSDVGDFFFGEDQEDIVAPGPSALDTQLSNQLTQANNLNKQFLPLLLEEDFDAEFDDEGNLVSVARKAPTELDQINESNQLALAKQSASFLRGEGEVPPGLKEEIAKQRSILEESLRNQLGDGALASTTGIDALNDFDLDSIAAIRSIQHGEMGGNEALRIASERNSEDQNMQTIQKLFGAQNSTLKTAASTAGQTQFDRSLALQLAMANQNKATPGVIGSLFGAVGTGAGAGIAKGAAGITANLFK